MTPLSDRSLVPRPARCFFPRPLLVVCACLAMLVSASVLPAEAPWDGRTIEAVEISGLRALPEETLLYYLGIERGGALDSADLDARIHELWNRDLLDDIAVDVEDGESGGVRLVLRVRERPVLDSVEYEGVKRISKSDIQERVSRDRIRVIEGTPLSQGELFRLKRTIEDLYREKGYRLAEATYSLEPVGTDEYKVIYTIDEGDKIRIGDIAFEGNTVFRDIRLRWVMKDTKESGLVTRVLKKDIYNPATLDEDLGKVKELYRDAGYKNITLGEPAIEVRGSDEGKRRLGITIPVEEGQRWKLGKIQIEGNERFADDLLLSVFKRPRGDWLRSSVIDKGTEAIQEIYSNSGHLFARIDTEIRDVDDQTADVVLHVDEGDQFRVGRIEFTGNTRTKDKVVRRELRVQEGLVLNAGALRNSLRRIGQLEFFKVDEDDPVNFDFDAEAKTVDVTVKGEEGDRTELQLGGGWSEVDGFFGQLSVRTRNFLGRGESVGVSIQTGRYRNLYDLSYFAPWFLDRPQTVGIQLFRNDLDYSLLSGQDFFQKSTGVTLTYGRNLGIFQNVSISYSLFDAEDRRTLLALDGSLVTQEFTRAVSSVRTVFTRNTIDSLLNPTNGWRLSASMEVAGGFIGGDTDFLRPRITYTWFVPVTKGVVRTVGQVNLEGGYIVPYNGQELFFLDRFYLGGENSVRGFRYRSLWVRDKDGNTVVDEFGTPLGGDKFVQANLEYHLLLGEPFRLLAFFDAGGVFAESQNINFDNLRLTAGLEFRLFVPVFGQPLRFILARNLDPLTDDRFESFQFSIGAGF